MQLLDVETAAARLSLHPETVRRLIRAGELYALKTGRVWKVEETEIAAYVDRLKAATNQTKGETR
jgi:excisionase family DNA binding protein